MGSELQVVEANDGKVFRYAQVEGFCRLQYV